MPISLPGMRLRARLFAFRHKAYIRTLSRFAPYYLVNEFPKSGGTWLAQMLAGALDLPFRRNQPVRFERSITHGHFLNPVGLHNVVVLWRDPRDLLVSYYYHCYFVNEHNNALLVSLMKQRLPFNDYRDIQHNLPAFIEFVSKTPVTPRFTWPEFARTWLRRPGVVQTSYEALRADTVGELVRVATAVTGNPLSVDVAMGVVDRHSFANVKAAAGDSNAHTVEMSFVREGAMGGWRKHFNHDAEAALREYGYEAMMREVGYTTAQPDMRQDMERSH